MESPTLELGSKNLMAYTEQKLKKEPKYETFLSDFFFFWFADSK